MRFRVTTHSISAPAGHRTIAELRHRFLLRPQSSRTRGPRPVLFDVFRSLAWGPTGSGRGRSSVFQASGAGLPPSRSNSVGRRSRKMNSTCLGPNVQMASSVRSPLSPRSVDSPESSTTAKSDRPVVVQIRVLVRGRCPRIDRYSGSWSVAQQKAPAGEAPLPRHRSVPCLAYTAPRGGMVHPRPERPSSKNASGLLRQTFNATSLRASIKAQHVRVVEPLAKISSGRRTGEFVRAPKASRNTSS